ncbi:MAG TPA: peptidoglycan-binding domain-containing protein [Candidatus Paceibacterota bacterium]
MKKLVTFLFAVALVLPLSLNAVTNQDAQIAELMAKITALQQKIEALRAGSSASDMALSKTPLSVATEALTRNLARGQSDAQTNGEVTRLQRALSQIPEARFEATNATGFYGPITEAAVRRVQEAKGIVSSGSAETTGYGAIGPRTRDFLNRKGGSVQVLYPNAEMYLDLGTQVNLLWSTPAGAPADVYIVDADYSQKTYTVAENAASGFSWIVGQVYTYAGIKVETTGSYFLKVCLTGSTKCDLSDSYFKIVTERG